MDSRQYEMGYTGVDGEPPEVWKDGAERLVKLESSWASTSLLTSKQFYADGTASSSGYLLLRILSLEC